MSPTKAAPKVEIWSVTGPDRADGDMGSQRFVSAARNHNTTAWLCRSRQPR